MQISIDMWVVWVKFHDYQIYSLRLYPQNHKNWDFQSLKGKKSYFIAYLDNQESYSNSFSSYNFL